MVNSTTSKDIYYLQKLPVLATFETIVAVIAILIIVTNSLVIKNIYSKTSRTRADSMFTLLSISDIGVGVLSMPSIGVYYPFRKSLFYCYYFHGLRAPLIIMGFCLNFPYIFSMILTAIIAIDRLFIIIWQNCYKDIISDFRLKLTVTVLLTISIGYCCLGTYFLLPERCCDILTVIVTGLGGIISMSMIAIILAYMRLLFLVRNNSKTMAACKHCNSKSDRRLSRTIFHILACQITCTVPYLTLFTLRSSNFSLYIYILSPWFMILRNCQCFCNAIILLQSQKRNARKHETFPLGKVNQKLIL